MVKKAVAVDEGIVEYNERYKQDTESRIKDSVYNWLVDKYTAKGKKFVFWDRFVWKGSVYLVPDYFGYILFFGLFYYLGGLILDRAGFAQVFMFFMLLVLWRLNTMIGYLKKINSKN